MRGREFLREEEEDNSNSRWVQGEPWGGCGRRGPGGPSPQKQLERRRACSPRMCVWQRGLGAAAEKE